MGEEREGWRGEGRSREGRRNDSQVLTYTCLIYEVYIRT